MKTQKWIKLAFVALFGGFLLQSCSQEESIIPQEDLTIEQSFTVRPDFATVDNRPENVIAQFQVIETQPVKLNESMAKGGKYALVIGISDYEGTANDLTYCDDDAMDWKAQLQAEGYTVTSIVDRSATKSAIESAVNTLASQSIAGNEIAFVYSGHGSKGNIVTTDLYYINYSWFKTKFSTAKSTKMMFTFDACQIGAMASALKATGRVIAVASSTNTYSYDGDATMKNGVFTYYQMVGLDQLNYIYFEPDCAYAVTKMKEWAKLNRVRVAPSYVDSYTGDLNI
ncbi:MAG: caspase domain-containing protein [Bacteroidales bacterium]